MRRLTTAVLCALACTGLAAPAAAATTAARCTTSRAAFVNPFHNRAPYGDANRGSFTALQVFQHGVWGGFAYDGVGDVIVLSWRPGSRPRELDYRRFRNTSFALSRGRSVHVAGVMRSGVVVADVHAEHAQRHWAFAYGGGRRFQLRTPRSWRDVRVLAVTDRDTIIGYGTTGSASAPAYHVVVWSGVHTAPRLLITLRPGLAWPPAADQAGDVVWTAPQAHPSDPAVYRVRLASGAIRVLSSPFHDQVANPWVAAGHDLVTSTDYRTVRWSTSSVPRSGPLPGRVVSPRSPDDRALAAGPGGVVVGGGDFGPTQVTLPGGRTVAVPGDYGIDEAVGPYDRVAFTAAKDHLVHILSCH